MTCKRSGINESNQVLKSEFSDNGSDNAIEKESVGKIQFIDRSNWY